jgi:DNA-binding GntR family transcriptional regulator
VINSISHLQVAGSVSTQPSRAEEVYAHLKKDIADFRLVPGDRFSEHDICNRLAVSRTPVRQALFRLQQEGLVEVMFRSGWRVLPFDFDRFDQLYDLRMVLTANAFTLLAIPKSDQAGDGALRLTSTNAKAWDKADDNTFSAPWN